MKKKYLFIILSVLIIILGSAFSYQRVMLIKMSYEYVYFDWNRGKSPNLEEISNVLKDKGFKISFESRELRAIKSNKRNTIYSGDYNVGFLLDDIVMGYDVSYSIKPFKKIHFQRKSRK